MFPHLSIHTTLVSIYRIVPIISNSLDAYSLCFNEMHQPLPFTLASNATLLVTAKWDTDFEGLRRFDVDAASVSLLCNAESTARRSSTDARYEISVHVHPRHLKSKTYQKVQNMCR